MYAHNKHILWNPNTKDCETEQKYWKVYKLDMLASLRKLSKSSDCRSVEPEHY